MLSQTFQWVAAYTAPRSEKKVTTRIIDDLHLEAYLPMHHTLRKWSDRVKMVEVPLIPSYTFVKLRECDLMKVKEVYGVVGFVSFRGTGIAVISEKEMEAMRRFAESLHEVYVLNTNNLKKGAQVSVVAGEFQGMQGTIVRDCKEGNFAVQIANLNMSLVINLPPDVLQVSGV